MLEKYAVMIKDFPEIVTLLSVVCLVLFAWLINIIFKRRKYV
jgi:hypothetical protein